MYKKRLSHSPKLELTKRQRMHLLLSALVFVFVMAYAVYLAAHSTEIIVRRSISDSKAN